MFTSGSCQIRMQHLSVPKTRTSDMKSVICGSGKLMTASNARQRGTTLNLHSCRKYNVFTIIAEVSAGCSGMDSFLFVVIKTGQQRLAAGLKNLILFLCHFLNEQRFNFGFVGRLLFFLPLFACALNNRIKNRSHNAHDQDIPNRISGERRKVIALCND